MALPVSAALIESLAKLAPQRNFSKTGSYRIPYQVGLCIWDSTTVYLQTSAYFGIELTGSLERSENARTVALPPAVQATWGMGSGRYQVVCKCLVINNTRFFT